MRKLLENYSRKFFRQLTFNSNFAKYFVVWRKNLNAIQDFLTGSYYDLVKRVPIIFRRKKYIQYFVELCNLTKTNNREITQNFTFMEKIEKYLIFLFVKANSSELCFELAHILILINECERFSCVNNRTCLYQKAPFFIFQKSFVIFWVLCSCQRNAPLNWIKLFLIEEFLHRKKISKKWLHQRKPFKSNAQLHLVGFLFLVV